ncbi:hypothetical protein C4553_02835, partial [Candidatus Parcubacteria bacterium]
MKNKTILFLGLVAIFFAFTVNVSAQTPVQPVLPTLPQRQVDISMPNTTGYATMTVNDTGNPTTNGQNLQTAVNNASCNPEGTIIYLKAGVNYDVVPTNGITLPAKNCAPGKWIIIRSDAPDSSLPSEGVRINPSYAPLLPKLRKTGVNGSTFFVPVNGNHYRIMFLEFTTTVNTTINSLNHITLGDGSGTGPQDTLAEVPRYLVVDRVYIHGSDNPARASRRGVTTDCGDCAVINSYISQIHEVGFDTQAVGGWNGDGPVLIDNNYLEAAGENIMFGGAVSKIPGVNPNDITITRNHIYKPTSWFAGMPNYAGVRWSIKNLFELKTGVRMLVEGNILENNWDDAQDGSAFVIKTTNSVGASGPTWPLTSDITIRYNKVINARGGVGGSGGCYPDVVGSACTPRVRFENNIMWDMGAYWSDRYMLLVSGAKSTYSPPTDLSLEHNTIIVTDKWNVAAANQANNVIAIDGAVAAGQTPFERFAFHNNIMGWGNAQYGIHESCSVGGVSTPCTTANSWFKNIFYDRTGCAHPNDVCTSGTALPMASVGFTDSANNNYKLIPSSLGYRAATDGKDVGADVDMVNSKTVGVISGVWSGSQTPPPPPPTSSCTNPPLVPSGFATPCPVLSLSASSV